MTGADLARRITGGLFADTPVIRQSEAAECGLACLAMIAGRHGHALDLPGLRRRFNASLKGMTLRDLVRLGAELKLATRAVRLDIGDLAGLRLPCILHWNHNHFVVLTEVRAREVVIHDPAVGRKVVKLDEVSRRFTGVALEAWPTSTFEQKDERTGIGFFDLIRRTRGITPTLVQVLAISLLIELAIIAMPIGFQIALDEVVVAADLDLLTLIALSLAVLLFLQVAATLVRSWATLKFGSSLVLQWKVALFDHLLRLPMGFFERRHVGDVVSRFGSLDTARQTLTSSTISALLDGVMSIALLGMMAFYGGWLVIIPLVSVSLFIGIRVATHLLYRAKSEDAIVHAALQQTHFMETARGIASVKVLNLEERRRGAWINHLVEHINAQMRVGKLDAGIDAAGQVIFGLDRILLIYLGIRGVVAADFSVGVFIAFLAYKDQFAQRMNSLVDAAQQFMMLSLHGERIADIALAEPEGSEGGQDNPIAGWKSGGAASLSVRAIRFRYADNEPDILSNLSFDVRPGECVGIAGPSGAGKTTLLKILAGLAQPSEGQVLVDNVPVSSLTMSAYRRRIGCVLQDDRLFAGSIADNICAFDPEPDIEHLTGCARLAAIHDEILTMPMGYETLVGDMGSSLSGGQRQRIVLARALYRRPAILLLDEATSHLDPENEAMINRAVRALPMTRIVIAHRTSTLAATDRVIRLQPANSAGFRATSASAPGAASGR
ncbi:MAG: peptidase domain-containing ABC transporter [Proteobacteria bacterium]|nr:peptidase domain-containing ABC transporter [Pseudomonadota bacterium]